MIEGIKVKGKMIPNAQLSKIWAKLTLKPFPKVRAFRLMDTDFDSIVNVRKCAEDETREMKEWGRVLSAKGTDACVFNIDSSPHVNYVILVRQNPYHDPVEVLEHELSHIARGDL